MSEVLRVLTLNMHKGFSRFSRGMVIHELREGLRGIDADLVFLQEVQGRHERHAARFADWPSAPQHEFLAEARWLHAYGKNAVYDHGHHGNAILSRYPFVSSETENVSDHRFERRGLLHSVIRLPGWQRNLHCLCVHLSLHERGRRRQLEAIAARLDALVAQDMPVIVAGDFNDWRQYASEMLGKRLGMSEVSLALRGRSALTFPSWLPLLRLDRIYVRGLRIVDARVHRDPHWKRLSDHLPVSAELRSA
ncbi:MAG: endonuclease/exonuclease/phosphatase family protein [Betaproteobacteria bacterium]|nr:endonuclease/exonuclease/phosphatase family protein [Betaproteobacteria bacterium]